MEIKLNKPDWFFFLGCLFMGVVAEEAFFRSQIGVSYFIFIAVFYTLFFWRFRGYAFTHQRLGYLILISIWLLSSSYYLYDSSAFYALNIVLIPSLVIFHLSIITAPKQLDWSQLSFVFYTIRRVAVGIIYSSEFTVFLMKWSKQRGAGQGNGVWKKIILGLCISVPFLFVIISLLMSADTQFERILTSWPEFLTFRVDIFFRLLVILIYGFGFFGFLQVIKGRMQDSQERLKKEPYQMDGIVTLTVLTLLDMVYILFVAIQFTYFFSGNLEEGYTYAEYARRGFFELLFVTLINLTVTVVVIHFTQQVKGWMRRTLKFALTIVILSSGVLLFSAFMRMMMYEDAYGYTFTRVLVHTFMIFLMVILAYTLLKIWLEKLSLFHFYFISALIYYTGINMVHLDQVVVDLNMERYVATEKIDIQYMGYFSATGTIALIELYKQDPDVPGLKELLQEKKSSSYVRDHAWQSTNRMRDEANRELGQLHF